MAKDYSKIKALAEDILKCIGDESEGENPSLPKQKEDIGDGGQAVKEMPEFLSTEKSEPAEDDDDDEKKSKSKDSSLAMMGSMLASKFGK
jgi:hypothetical protein